MNDEHCGRPHSDYDQGQPLLLYFTSQQTHDQREAEQCQSGNDATLNSTGSAYTFE